MASAAAGVSQDSLTSQAAAQYASNVVSRVPVALHCPQAAISPATAPPRGDASPVLGGSGYGPPVLTQLTSVQRIVKEAVEVRREYDLVCLPVTNDRWKERWERMCVVIEDDPRQNARERRASNRPSTIPGAQAGPSEYEAERWRSGGGFTRAEVNVIRSEETRNLIGLASEWLELDSDVEGIRFDSEIALKQEVQYASHLHISSMVLPMPRNPAFVTDYARAVNAALACSAYIHVAVRIPISNPLPSASGSKSAALDETSSSPWETWNTIRHLCAYSNRLHLALDLTNPLPPAESLARWQAESLGVVWLPATTFIPNAKGYPVLSKSVQAFLRSVMRFKPTFILSGVEKGTHTAGGPDAYAQYIRFLERKMPADTPVEAYAGAYMDYLQAPLQPLMDNLETDTYEGFEKDPIKYQQYEEAVYQALMDRPAVVNQTIEIFVCGAGRGPLVAGCLKAAARAGNRRVKITAVEKNPNAFVILQERKAVEWGTVVDLVFSDMRTFTPTIQADIIVSELLGSFGDNELSPECLDGVIPRLLKPDGVSIPYSYTSYLAPIASSKLHDTVTSVLDADKAEQPYVVMFQQANIVSEEHNGRERIQSCWSFQHPRHDVVLDHNSLPVTNSHNTRSNCLTFHIPHATVCHGFAGYFEALLYGDVGISIHPERMDPNMLSWFPCFFPFREPLHLPARSEVDIHVFRLTDPVKRRVWFEWSAEAFLPLPSAWSQTSASGVVPATPASSTPGMNWGDAFASAPSPRVPSSAKEQAYFDTTAPNDDAVVRVKIGQTRLHNPNGKSNWVGL